ncbi:surface presentation of antigens (SPOA) protein [Arcobacter nitrofigilis DSM 7299]|uniref:Flagellar motor switch protein FliN n=1 Tax=Arcobacter nitrofigilis (strain ATCC 33309 / DSM 7299 / CCUG 15893 / LMG 7604 / NCTC 12251 / CI) TaxID=572480 RepID=D5UZ89_ARCNC|nr:FliM/FliN family flagellar motor switch protein [Arcobacter nitrofigilis]ADG94141.1 surface presentation of antigens (SPOA) protein [Arcobacter nitrofigilis DSM 7299]
MASDLSNILRDELSNTLEQLLSQPTKCENVEKADFSKVDSSQCVEIDVKFEFKNISSTWNFFIPTSSAARFEYLMLGGTGDLKEHIDDEITDAINEIVSNICGSISTSVNAQGFPDISGLKHEILGSKIIECNGKENNDNTFSFKLNLDNKISEVIISFDDVILPFLSEITGKEADAASNNESSSQGFPSLPTSNGIDSLLSDESSKNLKLLFDIKLKLSVRLGTKLFLLKDILKWDIGEIIELEQMVNEPLDILVNGIKIGEGEAVIVEGKFGLKIKNIGNDSSRLSQLGLG